MTTLFANAHTRANAAPETCTEAARCPLTHLVCTSRRLARGFGTVHSLWLTAGLVALTLSAGAGGVVTNCSEACLRSALAAGGMVTFACDGTVSLAGTISNTLATVLDGRGHQVALSGNSAVRIFYVGTNVALEVANLTLANGYGPAGSAIFNDGGNVSLSGVTLLTNVASDAAAADGLATPGAGGAIYNRGGVLSATNCVFAGNVARIQAAQLGLGAAPARGGAIRNESGQLNLQRCGFSGNQALGGPAMFLQTSGISAAGGAIDNSGGLMLSLCVFAQNLAVGGSASGSAGGAGGTGWGGAINNGGTIAVDQSSFVGNRTIAGAGGSGGGAGGSGGSAFGGAIGNSGTWSISRSTFASNSVTGGNGGSGAAGGVYMDLGLPGNNGGPAGAGDGGALWNSGSGSVVNCTINANIGSGGGGGAGGQGGGPYVRVGGNGGNGGSGGSGCGGIEGTCNLTNCTIAGNIGLAGSVGSAGPGGSGVSFNGSPGVPGNPGIAVGGTSCAGLVNSLIASNAPPGNDTFPDPRLAPLADNGGPTWTMALLVGSPAIDAGDTTAAPPVDQRGFPRPAGAAADLGAFEYGSVMPTIGLLRTGATGILLFGYGNTGQVCRLLASSNWSVWTPLATNRIDTTGSAQFYDNCGLFGCRFYRLVMP